MATDKELIDIVNKTGEIIGKATRSQVYKEGLLHSAVNIIVVNKKGQIFIQRRSSKKILPLYWDISASEHVKFSPWGLDELNYLNSHPFLIGM